MKVRVTVGAEAAYACLEDETFSLDIRLAGGRSAAQSLREQAIEWRRQADRLDVMASRAEQAARLLEHQP